VDLLRLSRVESDVDVTSGHEPSQNPVDVRAEEAVIDELDFGCDCLFTGIEAQGGGSVVGGRET
jgi:hypothetical protein